MPAFRSELDGFLSLLWQIEQQLLSGDPIEIIRARFDLSEEEFTLLADRFGTLVAVLLRQDLRLPNP